MPIKSGVSELRVVKLNAFKIKKSEAVSIVSITKSVSQTVTSKAIEFLENSFDVNTISLQPSEPLQPLKQAQDFSNLPRNLSNNKKIKVDGVDFEIGAPVSTQGVVASEDLPTSAPGLALPNFLNLNNIGQLSSAGSESATPQNLATYALNKDDSNRIRPHILKGQIELAGGAVYPGERFQFYIQRVYDGMVQERGEVNAWTGEYVIAVKQPKGALSIELRHDSGALIAIGNLSLEKKLNLKSKNLIQIFPSEDAENIGQVLSYESFEDHEVTVGDSTEIYIDGNESIDITNQKGQIANNLPLAPGSQILVSASHKGYWNSLQIAEAGRPMKTVMHSDKHMKAFLQLIEPYLKKAKIKSVIWGRVSNGGDSKSEVKVSLHSFSQIQPLYFSYRIPNPDLQATSSDGFFAFVNPPEGLHIVKTNQSDIPLESVVVRQGHTSIIHLETAPRKNVSVYSFDAFGKKESVPARLSVPGTDSIWDIGGRKSNTLPFFDTASNMVMDVEPLSQDYIATRFFVGRRRSAVQLPHFKKSWLQSVLAQQKVNQKPGTTQVLGWVEKGAYAVDIYPKTENTKIFYFNLKGNIVEQLTDGGGYIATNVPAGVVTSTLNNTQTYQTIKRLSISEPYRLSVNYIDLLD